MKMSELEAHAQFCLMNKLPLTILVMASRFPMPEKIIIPFENIPFKMEYLKFTYNEECENSIIEGEKIVSVVDTQEQILLTGVAQASEELKVGEATFLSPCTSSMLENHVRVEDGYTVESREKQIVIEGRVEDVMKVLKYIKEGEKND